MKRILAISLPIICVSCGVQKVPVHSFSADTVTVAFGSCDNQRLPNELWDDVAANRPAIWIWGGDNVYCDTNNMQELQKCYADKLQQPAYREFAANTPITGTWDDHDYARNDGGAEFEHRKESEQLFYDFMKVPANDRLRNKDGVYRSELLTDNSGRSIRIINLDTRFFRSALTPDPTKTKRYVPQNHGTMLGTEQWEWLERELKNSRSDFNIIVSSVQVLSDRHGFESWGNMPNEVKKLEDLIVNSKAKNVIILSGDRHIAEFSEKQPAGLSYPLIDFTSSGLTHVYEGFKEEENPYRKGRVINKKNFGVLVFDLAKNKVRFEMRGEDNVLYQSATRQYPK